MKKIHNEDGSPSKEGSALMSAVIEDLKLLFQKHMKNGYSPWDIELAIHREASLCSSESFMRQRIAILKERAQLPLPFHK